MSIHSVYLRQRLGKEVWGNVFLPFRITQKHYFAFATTQRNKHVRPKIVSGGILQRSIPSSEIKLIDDTVRETATRHISCFLR